MAHNEPELLKVLISLIDDNRNDIYVMVDLKADIHQFDNIKTKHSKLTFCKNRTNIFWGDISQIKNEINLFEEALQSGVYSYLHLISGVDLPLKNQDDIHSFFMKNAGYEFIGFKNNERARIITREKIETYQIFCKSMRYENNIKSRIIIKLRKICNRIQLKLGIKRHYSFKEFGYGDNWVSITSDFAKHIISQKDRILHDFRRTFCADEIYKQSLALEYSAKIYKAGSLRKIDWKRGLPYVWRDSDFNELINSDCLFARKFSNQVDSKIIEHIQNHILHENSFNDNMA